MRKLYIILFATLIIGGFCFYVLYKFGPNIIVPSKNIKQYVPISYNSISLVKIPESTILDVYYDFKYQKPSALALDPKGVLFVSFPWSGKVVAIIDENRDLKPERSVEVLSGLKNPFGISFDSDYFFVAERDEILRYRYNENNLSLSDKKVLIKFPLKEWDLNRSLKVVSNILYFNKENKVFSSDLNGQNIFESLTTKKHFDFFEVDSRGKIWVSDYYGINLDIYNNLINVQPGKIVKQTIFADNISKEQDLITGFREKNETLGLLLDVVIDKDNNLFISDPKTGLIYVLSKELR